MLLLIMMIILLQYMNINKVNSYKIITQEKTFLNSTELKLIENAVYSKFIESHSAGLIADQSGLNLAKILMKHLEGKLSIPLMINIIGKNLKVPAINWTHEAHHLLIIENTKAKHFNKTLHAAKESPYFLQNSYTFIIDPVGNIDISYANKILSYCWQYFNMYNVVILAKNNNDILTAYTFIPYYKNKRCSSSNAGKTVELNIKMQLFPDKMSNMRQCSIHVVTTHVPPHSIIIEEKTESIINTKTASFMTRYDINKDLLNKPAQYKLSGIFGEILNLMRGKMNVTFNIDKHDAEDGKIINKLRGNECDMLCIVTLPTTQLLTLFDVSHKFGETGITFAVPKADLYPSWTIIYRSFDSSIWLLILLSLLSISLVFKLIIILLKNYFKNLSQISIIWMVIASYWSNTPITFPIYSSSARVIITLLLLTGIIFDTLYQSAIYTEMSFPDRQPDINTINDLMQSTLSLKANAAVKQYFINSDRKELMALASKCSNSIDYEKEFEQVINGTVGLIAETFLLKTLRNKREVTENKIHLGSNHQLMVYYTGFYLRKQSLFTEKIDDIIGSLVQTGLLNKWYKDWLPKNLINTKEKDTRDKFELTMSHLIGCFILWIIGTILSILVFIFEIYTAKYFKASKFIFKVTNKHLAVCIPKRGNHKEKKLRMNKNFKLKN